MAAAEVSLAGTVKSFQTAGHELSLRPSTAPLKPKDGLSGPLTYRVLGRRFL